MPSSPLRKEPQKAPHPPTVMSILGTSTTLEKSSSQLESFLRRAKEAGVKIEEEDWEVVRGNGEEDDMGDEEWVLVN
ncbi:hypothetical protein E8E11_006563 [Didymella keratinophila]|nr:hypothetical protein E8E11_006563 [Didymella keratinophila]